MPETQTIDLQQFGNEAARTLEYYKPDQAGYTGLAKSLKMAPDDVDTAVAFDRYGMDSVVAVELTGELEQRMGKKLEPTLLYDYPTIDALSAYLATV